MPAACLNYLKSGALAKADFWRQDADQLMFALITTFQFVTSLLVISVVFVGRKDLLPRGSVWLL